MCGIAGIVSETGGDLTAQVSPMIDAQRHRGPDASGLWSDENCALGHRRLAIIDLSEAGRQPLSNEDGTIWITFNGEIYNFQSLRDDLEKLGHTFRTRTDTEAIVHAYEQWGSDCVKRLRGMFAFAVWDQPRRRLFLARDRAGKKPLVYAQVGNRFFFASELQGLLAAPEVPREVNLEVIDSYLSWGYVPAPETAFQGVFKLPAAHSLTVDLTHSGTSLHLERYWSLQYEPKLNISEEEAAEALREKMIEAVRLRMISDVPLGAFLSGGIDSSIVVGLMAALSDRPVKTFSIGFDEAAFNELNHARRVAERWGADHHEFVVRPDALSILPKLVRHFGEPFADDAALPTFYLSEMTRTGVTVALNGDGGDESFAGYGRYYLNRVADRISRVPGAAIASSKLMRAMPQSVHDRHVLRRACRFFATACQPRAKRYGRWVGCLHEDVKARLYSSELTSSLDNRLSEQWMEAMFAEAANLDGADAGMAVDLRSYLPDDLLVKVDIASMVHSLEARSPFLDHQVMEFAARLPADFKLRGRQSKYLLKRAFRDLLPAENVARNKMGFNVPVGQWFRGPLGDLLRDTLLSERALARGYFQPRELKRLVAEHTDERADHSFLLWALLMLELWHVELVDTACPAASEVVIAGHTRRYCP